MSLSPAPSLSLKARRSAGAGAGAGGGLLSLTTSNGDVVFESITVLEDDEIEIVIVSPVEYAGTYTVAVSALETGPYALVDPALTGTADVGEELIIRPGLWVFDADIYPPFTPDQPVRTLRRDNVEIETLAALTYTTVSADGGTDLVVRENLLMPDGVTPVNADSAALSIAAPPAYVPHVVRSTGLASSPIAQAMPTTARTLLIAGKFRPDSLTRRARLVGINTAGTLPRWGVQVDTTGVFSVSVGSAAVGPTVISSAAAAVAVGQWVPFVALISMDQIAGGDRIRCWYAPNGVEATLFQGGPATAAGEFIQSMGSFIGHNGEGTVGQRGAFSMETYLWVGKIDGAVPNITTAMLRDAFFAADAGAPAGWRWNPLGSGAVNPGGLGAVSPFLWFGGEAGWGQFEGEVPTGDFSIPLDPAPSPGSGRWYVPNDADPADNPQRAVIVFNSQQYETVAS
jgi:hypothetical protein